jgi:hypothetical protein
MTLPKITEFYAEHCELFSILLSLIGSGVSRNEMAPSYIYISYFKG